MIDTGIERGEPPPGAVGSSAAALFQWQWRIYRKVVDNNYLFHREAYERLHNLLSAEVAGPFHFLDIACGDASATVDALEGTQVAHYYGIDVSRSALDIAEQTLRVLSCPVDLYESDFVQALKDWRESGRRRMDRSFAAPLGHTEKAERNARGPTDRPRTRSIRHL